MKKTGEGNVVMEFKVPGANIQICDDYCRNVTPEQADEIIRRISHQVQCMLQEEQRQATA